MEILIVDDEKSQRDVLGGYLKKLGHRVVQAVSRTDGREKARVGAFDLVLTDFKMPDGTGFELLKDLKAANPGTSVVLMTAFGTIEGAVAAMKEGAYDYLGKPIDLGALDLLIGRIEERRHLLSENKLLREQLAEKHSFEGMVAQSDAMQGVLSMASRVAESAAPVLIRGESGTGKEFIARLIHHRSPRADKPFIAVNCAALNENLLESELFGHEKGAFTGADKLRRGRFELADGGTLFLDEIGDISPATQVRLLRVLQEHAFERVGGSETLSVDVRVLAATNKKLEEAIAGGTFREDLLYRLNVVTVEIPPLRNRRDDIAPLLELYRRRFAAEAKRKTLDFSREAWDLLLRYNYPGNVRELENIVQRAVILSRGAHITTADLPAVVRSAVKEETLAVPAGGTLTEKVEQLEKDLIFEALRIHANNQSKAADHLGISERNLRYRLKKWGVK